MFAADLDGNGTLDNKFGHATAVLATTQDLSPDGADMIASGHIRALVYIVADDLENDDSVAITLFGGLPISGRLVDGVFTTTGPHLVPARLPVFVNANASVLLIEDARLELRFDEAGGVEGVVRGGIDEMAAREAAHLGLLQMIEAEPERHLVFARGIDEDRDDVISYAEAEGSVIGVLVSSDIGDRVSIGFGFHATPDAITATPQTTCRDRVRDGDETDIDCGGGCQRCAGGRSCSIAADCQSNRCVAGSCVFPTCTDGVRDGLESDIDCGGICPACTTGQACAADRDCTSGSCSNTASLGTCG